MPTFDLGESIPPNTAHAVSVSLPTWRANIGYEEAEHWVTSKMVTGYPRFFIHKSIEALSADVATAFGSSPHQRAMLFPTKRTARQCYQFIQQKAPSELHADMEIINLVLDETKKVPEVVRLVRPDISAVLFRADAFPYAKQYWQHAGDGVSSRRAEFCHGLLKDGLLIPDQIETPPQAKLKTGRGPRRYQRPSISIDGGCRAPKAGSAKNGTSPKRGNIETMEALESFQFLEERYGRNLNISLVDNAKCAIRRRIAGVLASDENNNKMIDLTNDKAALPAVDPNARGVSNLCDSDVYLMSCGMNAIFTAHQALMRVSGKAGLALAKSINFGFPYVDTLKVLQKFGPGCIFYGRASSADLDDLEVRLKQGEKFLALFCEFPGNPLLTCPDLIRIRQLAGKYGFAVVVDETIGTFANVNVLPFADMVVSSLTKIFSGDCNVMGGALVLNPGLKYYEALKQALDGDSDSSRNSVDATVGNGVFEDNYWAEDVLFMERNSRDFASRIDRINANAEAICAVLTSHPSVSRVYYPRLNDEVCRASYDAVRNQSSGGYGGLLSVTLRSHEQAVAFYNALETAKGPSLGTNFTLSSPYVLLAHYGELEWARELGVDPDLIRISVGLEDEGLLKGVFEKALSATEGVE